MTDALANVTTIVGSVMGIIEGNALFMTFACAGLVGVATGIIKKFIGRY